MGSQGGRSYTLKEAGLSRLRARAPPLRLPLALKKTYQGFFFSSVLLNEESNNPHFNYTRASFIIPLDLFK